MGFPRAKKDFDYNRTVCRTEGCDETARVKFRCVKCDHRIRKYGDPTVCLVPKKSVNFYGIEEVK